MTTAYNLLIKKHNLSEIEEQIFLSWCNDNGFVGVQDNASFTQLDDIYATYLDDEGISE